MNCTTVTAVDLPSGRYGRETILLVFHQLLWFDKLENSLINPNQVQAYGLSLCDDPNDLYSELSIQSGTDGTFIMLEMDETTCRMMTCMPTESEL